MDKPPRPQKLEDEDVERFVASHSGWTVAHAGLDKTYAFAEYAAALAFALRIGVVAEKRDHHPDIHISWGKVVLRWTTHDAGGITALDLELAAIGDAAYH